MKIEKTFFDLKRLIFSGRADQKRIGFHTRINVALNAQFAFAELETTLAFIAFVAAEQTFGLHDKVDVGQREIVAIGICRFWRGFWRFNSRSCRRALRRFESRDIALQLFPHRAWNRHGFATGNWCCRCCVYCCVRR